MPDTTTDRWAEPSEVSDIQIAFPADALERMPRMDEIPEDFPDRARYMRVVRHWFFSGLSQEAVNALFTQQDEREANAFRHLQSIIGSFAPKHEHKEAALAYLMHRWLTPDWNALEAAGVR